MSDQVIIDKKKKGYSLQELYEYYQSCQPSLDNFICLVHVSRVCHEANIPFSYPQLKRVYNIIHDKRYHGSPQSCWKFLSSFGSDKMIIIKTDHRGTKKKPVDPHFHKKEPITGIFLEKTGETPQEEEHGF